MTIRFASGGSHFGFWFVDLAYFISLQLAYLHGTNGQHRSSLDRLFKVRGWADGQMQKNQTSAANALVISRGNRQRLSFPFPSDLRDRGVWFGK